MENWLNFIRGLVRPFVAIIVSSGFVGLSIYAFIKYGDPDLAKFLIIAFGEVVALVIGFYYGQRQSGAK